MDQTNKLNSDVLIEINEKLIGNICAVGETNSDKKSLENIKLQGDVVIELLTQIIDEVKNIKRYECSMKNLGNEAKSIVEYVYELVNDCLDEYRTYKAINIKWDTSETNEESKSLLPNEVIIPQDIMKEDISDYLSDTYGYCHFGYELIIEK